MRKWFSRLWIGLVILGCLVIASMIFAVTTTHDFADSDCVTVRPGQTTSINSLTLKMTSMDPKTADGRVLIGAVLSVTAKNPTKVDIAIKSKLDNDSRYGDEHSKKWEETDVAAGESKYSIDAASYGDGPAGVSITGAEVCTD